MSEREEVRRTRSKKKKRKKNSLKTNGYRIKKNGYRIATSIKNKKYARDKFLLFPTTSIQIFTPHWVLKGHSCFNKSYFATFYNCLLRIVLQSYNFYFPWTMWTGTQPEISTHLHHCTLRSHQNTYYYKSLQRIDRNWLKTMLKY